MVRDSSTFCRATVPAQLPMKAGTIIQGLDVLKDQEQIVALERSAYPEFVDRLATPLPTLAQLRRLPDEEADDKLIMRYLKLKRRVVIKEDNSGREK